MLKAIFHEASRSIGNSLRPFALYLLIATGITTMARLALCLWFAERVSAVDGWAFIVMQGLRFDAVLQGLLLAFPLSLTPLLYAFPVTRKWWKQVLPAYLAACIGMITFMELATPQFIAEYDLRPNILFVEYLEYPREVFGMLWNGYRPALLAMVLIMPALLWAAFRLFCSSVRQAERVRLHYAIAVLPVLFLVCALAARSSFGHRPVNPSNVAFSTDPLVNMLPLNSAYSALYGVYEKRNETGGVKYGEIPQATVIATMRRMLALPDEAFIDNRLPTLHRQPLSLIDASRKKNLVIILEESLGAGFVGSLGGLPLTPNLDRYSSEGIWFTQMHATGTRSVRGIEAVITGFLPTTDDSVVKLGGTQQDFFTIADLLRSEGYGTSFIYGGSAQFDNMRRFFVNNGFETIIDEADYDNPQFTGSWGVSDEDLFRKADEYFDSLPRNRPFFSLVFSSSNHTPFEYPAGKIQPYNQPAATRENAIKYADHALGAFIEAARQSDYWNDTVFLVVADHDSRVHGAELVPIRHYHVPALILGAGIEPKRVDRLASQVDLVPTLLPLLGVDAAHPSTGVDLLRDDIERVPPHAVMQYGSNIAYRQVDSHGDNVIVFQEDQPPQQFRYVDTSLMETELDPALLEIALSHTEWPRLAYRHKWYRMRDPATEQATATAYAPAGGAQ